MRLWAGGSLNFNFRNTFAKRSIKTRFFAFYPQPSSLATMPRAPGTPRPPLGEVSPGRRNGIVGARSHGVPYPAIGGKENLDPSTCRRIVKNASHQTDCITTPQPGRPSLLSLRDQRHIFKLIAINPKITAAQLVVTTVLYINKKTVYRFLKKSGIQKWRCKKKPLLTEERAIVWLAWALKYNGIPLTF